MVLNPLMIQVEDGGEFLVKKNQFADARSGMLMIGWFQWLCFISENVQTLMKTEVGTFITFLASFHRQ